MAVTGDETAEFAAYVSRYMACEQCGTPYVPENVVVVLREDIRWTLLATCPVCDHERHIVAYDCPPYLKLRVMEPVIPARVTQATVDGWRKYLATFDGDVYDLLAE
ncbi:MAG: hypothetical protein GYB65_10550 [Chloroflexi bacterium]|nr:hypothetical protein [Chloroflexota bacterium]